MSFRRLGRSLRDRTRLRVQLWSLALRASARLTVLVAALTLLRAAVPLVSAGAAGFIIGLVPATVREGLGSPDGNVMVAAVLGMGLLMMLGAAAGFWLWGATESLGVRVDAVLQADMMLAASAPPGIGHLEDPEVMDMVKAATGGLGQQWARPGGSVGTLAGMISKRAILVGSCVAIGTLRWWLGLVLLAGVLWAETEARDAFARVAKDDMGKAGRLRRARYYSDVALGASAAKELRVFGLGRFLLDRFIGHWEGTAMSVRAVRRVSRRRIPLAFAGLAGAVTLPLVVIAVQAGTGHLSLTLTALYAQAVRVSITGITTGGTGELMALEYTFATLGAYSRVIERLRQPAPASGATASHRSVMTPKREIRFEGVTFSYPRGDRPVLQELYLSIPVGRSLALVGVNGAGKTTLVKLLCRLYEPGAGRITADGVDIRELDPAGWQRQIAVIFQDYVKYELPATFNIGSGSPERMQDGDAIRDAASVAGARDVVEALPAGWDTVLSPAYKGGADLSGGQWQRIALARALLAARSGARVLVLDEPTANLDVRAEAQIYDRFLEITAGLTTIVISHRMSTVRMAGEIVVLEDGRISERGSHQALLQAGGRYAEMFELQASRFREPAG